jgi:hypothetical protein
MTRWSWTWQRSGLFLAVWAVWAVVAVGGLVQAADPVAVVRARLAAGEFGPALAAARAVADPAVRDQLLGQIAAAQAQAGARLGSSDTLADISSDLARAEALRGMPGASPLGARGGMTMADFQSLIDLIQATVAPDSWDTVGGPGAISQFQGGVYVDSAGLVRKLPPQTDRSLVTLRRASLSVGYTGNPRKPSVLRKVSLPRLEREVQLLAAMGREPDEAMRTLAGMRRVQYVLVYPETGDLVLAGPAGDWRVDAEGRFVSAEKGEPVLNLDDLVVTLRNALREDGRFGCSINPRQDNLAAARAVQERWSGQPLKPGQRDRWLHELREAMGRQDIVVYGIDPRTRTARILVEADYRMKLVGIGLEEGVPGVSSYLASVTLDANGQLPPMNMLRWWFTLNYQALAASEGRDAFALRGPGVKVLSENEHLTELGERVHTGTSDEPTRQFAESFTQHFDLLAAKYPIYAELRNVFDLALVAAVLRSHDLPSQVGWHLTHFGPEGAYQPQLGPAPTEVETVMNYRILGGRHVVAAVSGGVAVDTRALAARDAVQTDTYGLVSGQHRTSGTPANLPRRAWWWD